MAQYQNHNEPNSESLLRRLREGDTNAFRDLYLLYYNRLFQYGYSIENNRDLVHDAIQELFVWFLQNPHQTYKIQNLDTYLFKSIRRNVSVLANRERQAKQKAQAYQAEDQEEVPSNEAKIIEAEQQLFQKEWLQRQISKLPAHQQEVLFLRFFENFDYDDIAEIFSVSNQVVRNTIFRALKNLRKNVTHMKSLWLTLITYLFIYLFH